MTTQRKTWLGPARRLAFACAVLMVAGCGLKPREPALADEWLAALNSHDADRVIRLLDPNATFTDPVVHEPLRLDALRDWLTRTWGGWKDRIYSVKQVVQNDDALVIEWHLQQTHPTGKSVPMDGVTVLRVESGHISAVRNYYDASVYLQFLKAS